MSDGVTVAQLPLEEFVMVRIHVGQPTSRPFRYFSGLDVISKASDLGENRFDDVSVNVGQAEVSARVAKGELLMIQAKQVQNGGV